MEPIFGKVKQHGEIELPNNIMKRLKLKVGEQIEFRIIDKKLIIRPRRSIVNDVIGAVELKDTRIIDKIINDTEFKE